MIQFHEIGVYKNAVNIGFCEATVEFHNGMVAEYDKAAKTAQLPTDAAAEGLALVMNTIEKPEVYSPNEYVIEVGEYPRLFTLASLKDRLLDMDMNQVSGEYDDISVGDYLIPNTDGQWEVSADASSYAAYLEVIEKTGYNSEGLLVLVHA